MDDQLTNNLDWTARLGADSALFSAIFAALSFVATVGGVFVAYRALIWAKKAAEAAQGQITVLEKQLALSQPRPVILLSISPTVPVLTVENVGEDVAFDVSLTPIHYPARAAGLITTAVMNIDHIAVLRKGDPKPLNCRFEPEVLPRMIASGAQISPQTAFLEGLRDLQVSEWKKLQPQIKGVLSLATVEIKFKNSSGLQYKSTFELFADEPGLFYCYPPKSLLPES